ncbi:MAG: hypothetical protein ACLTFB_00975 [Candidatus Phytoplasma pyri]
MTKKILKDQDGTISYFLFLIQEMELTQEDSDNKNVPIYGIIDQLAKITELLAGFVINGSGIDLKPIDDTNLEVINDIENKTIDFNFRLKDITNRIENIRDDLKLVTTNIWNLAEQDGYEIVYE